MKINTKIIRVIGLAIIALLKNSQAWGGGVPTGESYYIQNSRVQGLMLENGNTINVYWNRLTLSHPTTITTDDETSRYNSPEFIEINGRWFRGQNLLDQFMSSTNNIWDKCALTIGDYHNRALYFINEKTLIKSTSRGWYRAWGRVYHKTGALGLELQYNNNAPGVKDKVDCLQSKFDDYFAQAYSTSNEELRKSKAIIPNLIGLLSLMVMLLLKHRILLYSSYRKLVCNGPKLFNNRGRFVLGFSEPKPTLSTILKTHIHGFKDMLGDRDVLALRQLNRNLSSMIFQDCRVLLSPKTQTKLDKFQEKMDPPYGQSQLQRDNAIYILRIAIFTCLAIAGYVQVNEVHAYKSNSLLDNGILINSSYTAVAYTLQAALLATGFIVLIFIGDSSRRLTLGNLLRKTIEVNLYNKLKGLKDYESAARNTLESDGDGDIELQLQTDNTLADKTSQFSFRNLLRSKARSYRELKNSAPNDSGTDHTELELPLLTV